MDYDIESDMEMLEKSWGNPLEFWCDRSVQRKFPALSKVALRLYACPASSASAERLFSLSGNILTKKRMSMKCETVRKLTSLSKPKFL